MKLTIKKGLLIFVLCSALITILISSALLGYSVGWTGFADYTTPTGDFVRGKTFWDWMGLLLIPLILGFGAFLLNRSERKTERELSTDRQQEDALRAYLDKMANLLLKENLLRPQSKEVRNVARTHTLTVLRDLDGKRKSVVLNFLYEANLINSLNPIISLSGSDLSEADLNGVDLKQADLNKANLSKALLVNAVLERVNLSDADLRGANLRDAHLENCNLKNAIFEGANFEGAELNAVVLLYASLRRCRLRHSRIRDSKLQNAILQQCDFRGATLINNDFSFADLTGARIYTEQLQDQTLRGAFMPDGKTVPADLPSLDLEE